MYKKYKNILNISKQVSNLLDNAEELELSEEEINNLKKIRDEGNQ